MSLVTLTYKIKNEYKPAAKQAFFQLTILPEQNRLQKVVSSEIKCNLEETEYWSQNNFGFKILQYSSHTEIDCFDFEMKLNLEKQEVNPFDFLPVNPESELAEMQTNAFYLENAIFLRKTPLTNIKKEVAHSFSPFDKQAGVFDYLQKLNSAIHSYMQYTPNVTDTKTTATKALELQKGVCQDYAHIFVSIARHHGIPARYASGYLHQSADLIGDTQTHAWAEAYVPNIGWIGFDPTNNLLADHHYIKISHGCDYKDCSPLKGVLETSGTQSNNHQVLIINQ